MLRFGFVVLFSLQLVYASQLRQCYSCEGIQCQRTSRQNVNITCTDIMDICVTVYEGFSVSEKGCLSELSIAGRAKCESKDRQCQKCSGNLCNNQGRSDFKCIQCVGSESAKCNSDGPTLTASQCGLPTSANSYCYVKVVGENLQRGCALSVKDQHDCLQNENCSLCLPENTDGGNACNNFDLQTGKSGGAQHLISLSLALIALFALRFV